MDRILIEDLEVHFRVGVPEAERSRPQRMLITVEMETDLSAAAAADDLEQTIDYSRVARRLVAWGNGRSWHLIEKLAADVADLVCGEFGAQGARVCVKKFAVPGARYVAVEVRRP